MMRKRGRPHNKGVVRSRAGHGARMLAAVAGVLVGVATGDVAMADATVRGIVKAKAQATVSSELIAHVKRVPFKAGETFSAGETIVAFDCRRYEADLEAARADVEAARLTVAMNKKLRAHRAVGAHDLAVSVAKLNQAAARAAALRVRTDQCVVSAPFDGSVVEKLINEFEMPQSNAPLLKIVSEGALELGLVVPSHWLTWLKPGVTFRFEVEETGTGHDARILRVGAVVDPISRTANAEAELLGRVPSVRPGMSGQATFNAPRQQVTAR